MYPLQNLNYSFDALEPYIDTKTVGIHHLKHQAGYLNRLNAILDRLNYPTNSSIESLVKNIDQFPLEERGNILYNAGGVINHNLYFANISPRHANEPVGKLKQAITSQYGSYENFKKEWLKTAGYLVGSGYTFLVLTKDHTLDILNLSNQETPFSYQLTPLMTIDLWEHAYYLNYQSNRADYLVNFFELLDFDVINQNYEQAL